MVTPLSLPNLTNPAPALDYNEQALANAQTVGLPTTAWQADSPERDVYTSISLIMSQADVEASICVQAGFLEFAATGFVTYTDQDGIAQTVYVTPDPTIPAQNPAGALGWLDVLADGLYNVQRELAGPAGGTLAILNTSITTYGAFAIGAYHVGQPTGPTYSNTASLTIPPSAVIGTVSNVTSAAGTIEVTFSASVAPATGTVIVIAGVNGIPPLTGTTAWVVTHVDGTHVTLNGSAFSGVYASGGTVYAPTVGGFSADVNGTASNAAPNAVNASVTSLSGITCANFANWIGANTEGNIEVAARCKLKLAAIAVGVPGGAVTYYCLVSFDLAPLLTPPQALSARITRTLVTLDTTTGTAYATIANSNGAPISQDVAVVQAVLSAYTGITSFTIVARAAANRSIAVAVTVFLPAAFNTVANQVYFATAIAAYFQILNIGGIVLPGGTAPATNVVPFEAVIGAVYVAANAASIPLRTGDVQGTLDGGTANVQLLLSPLPEVAVPAIAVSLVSV